MDEEDDIIMISSYPYRSAHFCRDYYLSVSVGKTYSRYFIVLTVTDKGNGRRVELDSYRIQNRGGYGLLNYKRLLPERFRR